MSNNDFSGAQIGNLSFGNRSAGRDFIENQTNNTDNRTIIQARDGSDVAVETMGPIFVSHSHKDEAIVGALLELLGNGSDIPRGDILATSQDGMKIPGGVQWADFLQARLKDTPLVIVVVSQNYLASSFCMVELGALWVLDKKLVPLLIPPTTTGDLKHVLADIQMLKVDGPGLAEARRAVAKVLDEPLTNESDWPAADEKLRRAIEALSGPAELEAGP